MWLKNAVCYDGPGMGRSWMIAHGYHEEEPAAPEPVAPSPTIYSKYKIVRALGDKWPVFRAAIEAAGLWELWNAATELSEDDPAFQTFLAGLGEDELVLLGHCTKEG